MSAAGHPVHAYAGPTNPPKPRAAAKKAVKAAKVEEERKAIKRLLPPDRLAVLIELIEPHKDTHPDLYEYLQRAYTAYGGSTLYAVHRQGAICLQMHLQEF